MAFAGVIGRLRLRSPSASKRAARIAVNACHRGDVLFTSSRNLGFGGHETPDEAGRFDADREAVEAFFHACERFYPLCYFCANSDT
jgi:hypothetical protein